MNGLGVAIMAAVVLPQQPHSSEYRTPIEKHLAGYTLDKAGTTVIRDSISGCYLVRTGD